MSQTATLRHAFRALKHRNFQLFWAGQGISVIGTWMQMTAQSWLIYRLTHSPLVLGFLTVARFGPSLVVAPLAGHVADRFPRKRVVILTQSCSLVLASVLAFLALSGRIRVGHILGLAFLQGCVDSMDMTVRQTFQMDLVGAQDLHSAVSLNSAAFNSARMVGPFLAGILIARLGEGPCFALNAASYLAVLATLILIRVPRVLPDPGRPPMLDAIATGMRYAWTTPEVRRVMLAIAITSSVGLSANTLTPALARDILGTGSQGYGRLLAGAGVGSVLGALIAAGASTSRYTPRVNALTLCGIGASALALSFARTVPEAVLCMTLTGAMAAIQLSTSNTWLQMSAPVHLRGRVVSMYVWIFQGMAPLGGFGAGWLASRAGIPWAIKAAGAACLAAGLLLTPGRSRPGGTPPASPPRS